MRPEYVKMEAFGSYLKPTVCDFTALYASRLFLITGPTGGGKTTILDAMSFALYGSATGGERKFRDMRCLAADPDKDTVVEFVFSLGDKRYRFVRRLHIHKKRTGEVDERITAECYTDGDDGWRLISSVAKDVSGKAQEILGFTHEQFVQVIVLPQGEFRKLLLAKSDEKNKILQVLFGTGIWEKCVDRISRKKRELYDSLDGLRRDEQTLLGSVECENFEVLQAKLAAAQAEREIAEKDATVAIAARDRAAESLAVAEALAADFGALDKAIQTQKELEARRPEVDGNRKQLAQARQVRSVLPTYHQWKTGEAAVKQKVQTAAAAKQQVADCTAAVEAAQANLAKIPGVEQKIEILREEIAKLNAVLPDAKRLKELQKQCKQAEQAAVQSKAKLDGAAAKRDELAGRIEKGEQVVREARTAYMQALSDNAAALLAGNLSDGTPCPVCGSVHHPAPADAGAQRDSETLSKKLKQVETLLGDLTKEFDDQKAAVESETAAHQTAERELAVARERYESVRTRLGDFGSYDLLAAALTEKQTEADRLRKACDRVKAATEKAGNDLAAAKATDHAAQEARMDAEKSLEKSFAEFRKAADTAGFAIDADFETLALDDGQMAELERKINQYDMDCAGIKRETEMLGARLTGKVRPETEKLSAEKRTAEATANAASAAVGRIAESCKRLQETVVRIEEMRKNSRELDAQYSRVTRLNELVSGKNINKTPLTNFVQGLMLDDVVAAATRFLRRLSRGRYALERTDYSGSGAGHRGLDIGVRDANTGGCRKADTLSGGEQFLASLSLAFGLSEVVQNAAGGVTLDSIFIDEGFGTLDSETLEAAMKALDDIRGEGRLVGIISHVSELKNRIPARIEVSTKDDGSHLTVKGI